VLSRLVVPALPPGEKCRSLGLDRDQSDRQRCRQLLQEMKGLQGLARAAYYECAIGFYLPDGSVRSVSALCEGEILQEERGGQGFAFDSIFRKHGYEGTFGEVSEEVFARVSHYRKAFERLKYHLEQVEADLVATKP
ncbi:MAG: non-canonical purine NTP pyrophosphatase, partial [Chlamydiia bacterium]|nr:non-canonical purine NTP pyrophosphatase [Chlamydiia bacterium]